MINRLADFNKCLIPRHCTFMRTTLRPEAYKVTFAFAD
jgi:hypothetical protein